MNGARRWAAVAAVAVAAAGAGAALNIWRSEPSAPEAADNVLGTIDKVGLAGLDGRRIPLEALRGKVVVVNFWATWCAPCREEIPLFVALQRKHAGMGLQFVGIAIDKREKVAPYAAELGMNFPILLGGADALDLARRLGNRVGVLPFTIVLRRDGSVASQIAGAATQEKLERLLTSLM